MPVDEKYLSMLFVNNYIGQCAQLCPVNVSRLFNDVSTSMKLEKAVSEIVCWRINTSQDDLRRAFDLAEHNSVNARSCAYWMNGLTKIDKLFSVYFSSFALLHVAYKISRNGFNRKLLDILETVLGRDFVYSIIYLSLRKTELDTSELVEVLQKSAFEHLTTYRLLVARDFGSEIAIRLVGFEVLYAYKHGDYQRCLQLSTQNVHTLLYASHMPTVPILPEFIQLFDNDIASLAGLIVIVELESGKRSYFTHISQITLSLYLMTQCQLKLRHSLTSLFQTLDFVKVAQRKHPHECTLDHLAFKLIERKVQVLQKQCCMPN